eukprot:SAG22_NODE_450_length_10398_cov_8.760171_11_plen_80_part_00
MGLGWRCTHRRELGGGLLFLLLLCPAARGALGRVDRGQLIATVGCERSGTARKGREIEGKAVITAFKSMTVASPRPKPA